MFEMPDDTLEILIARLKAEMRDRHVKWDAIASEIRGLQAALDIVEKQQSETIRRGKKS
jgi:hypothetical protein